MNINFCAHRFNLTKDFRPFLPLASKVVQVALVALAIFCIGCYLKPLFSEQKDATSLPPNTDAQSPQPKTEIPKISFKAKAIIVIGASGSGKSSWVNKVGMSRLAQAPVVDADIFKEKIPAYQEGIKRGAPHIADTVHAESIQLKDKFFEKTVDDLKSLIYVGTGASENFYTNGVIGRLKRAGYHVTMVCVKVELAKAIERVAARALKTGRDVPKEAVESGYTQTYENFESYKPLVHNWELYDNSGETFRLIASDPETAKLTPHTTFKARYYALLEDDQLEGDRPMVIPERRVCLKGILVSEHMWPSMGKKQFISDKEIIKVHPMRFLRKSPFVNSYSNENLDKFLDDLDSGTWVPPGGKDSILDTLKKQMEGIGRTQDGHHVILQQAARSCVPSCVAMLILDRGKTPNYQAIQETDVAGDKDVIQWIEEAGLSYQITELNPGKAVSQLSACLKEKGSGILTIDNSVIKGHDIVLDAISEENKTAQIRDPFHGWALTIRLDALLSWKLFSLIQVF